jgi:hypothetical protein
MTSITYTTLHGAHALELRTSALRLIAVYEYGPRVAHLSTTGGKNLLLWKPGKYKRGDWDLRGGHRAWVTRPGADECEDTYATDNGKCEVEVFRDGFRLIGAENKTNHTRRGFAVKVLAADKLEVDNFVINTGDLLYSGGLWALTCTVPAKGTRYAIPLGDASEWNTFSMVYFHRWAGHGQGGFADRQITVRGDLLTIEPRGIENKRMVQSHHGIIAMSDPSRQVTFAKRVAGETGGQYPLHCNLAFYIGPKNFMVELESMGAEKPLRPGSFLHHPEIWVLKPGAVPLQRAERLVELFF